MKEESTKKASQMRSLYAFLFFNVLQKQFFYTIVLAFSIAAFNPSGFFPPAVA